MLPLLLEPLPPVSLVSLLNLGQFASELQFHPDRSKVDYVLSGIVHGFDIGPIFSYLQRVKIKPRRLHILRLSMRIYKTKLQWDK